MKKITATSSRGDTRGTHLRPYHYSSGHYLISKGGNTTDCSKKVFDHAALPMWVNRGYSIRMSGKGAPAYLICPNSLRID